MKNKFKFIFLMIFIVLTFVTISSCKNNEKYEIDEILSDYFNSGSGTTTHYYYNSRAKFSIKTDKYNYAGHFRIICNNEEVFNSADYNYLVPKKTTIFSRKLAKNEDIYISFEILDYSAELTFRYRQSFNGYCYVPVTKDTYYKYFTNSYIKANMCDFKMHFNGSNVKKGLTYVLFTTDCDDYYLPQDGPLYIKSYNNNLNYEIVSSQCKDRLGNSYGYMIVDSKINNYELLDNSAVFSAGEHYDIFLGEESYSFEFTTNANYLELVFVNLNNDTQKYKISYDYTYNTISQLKNGILVSESSEMKSGTKYENTIELDGTSNAPSSGEIFGVKFMSVDNNESFNIEGKLIREYTYKVNVEMI